MNQPTIKVIALVKQEWILAYTIIRVNEIALRISRQDLVHGSLKAKVLLARNRADSYSALCEAFTDEERTLMRDYNTNYCENLAKAMISMEDRKEAPDDFFQSDGPIYLYYLATKIQLQFSTRY